MDLTKPTHRPEEILDLHDLIFSAPRVRCCRREAKQGLDYCADTVWDALQQGCEATGFLAKIKHLLFEYLTFNLCKSSRKLLQCVHFTHWDSQGVGEML